jgi:antitoxin ParD1/3/4
METITLPLPDTLKNFVDAEIAAKGYGNRADCIQALLQETQKRRAREKVEVMLQEGLDSGPSTEWTREDLEKIKQEIQERHARRNGKSP